MAKHVNKVKDETSTLKYVEHLGHMQLVVVG